MFIRFACPTCGKVIKVDPRFGGHEGRCPKCGAAIVVPTATEAAVIGPARVAGNTPEGDGGNAELHRLATAAARPPVIPPPVPQVSPAFVPQSRSTPRSVYILLGALACVLLFCLLPAVLMRVFRAGSAFDPSDEPPQPSMAAGPATTSARPGRSPAIPQANPAANPSARANGPAFTTAAIADRLNAVPMLRDSPTKRVIPLADGSGPGVVTWDGICGPGPGVYSVSVYQRGVSVLCFFKTDEVRGSAYRVREDPTVWTLATIIRAVSGDTMTEKDILDLIVADIQKGVARGSPFGSTEFKVCGRQATLASGTQNLPSVSKPWQRNLYATTFSLKLLPGDQP